ncbi:MAG: hypothetical protein M1465_01015 [Candidatus Marsarchaeota archaeon]|jgi:retron-type reverse transcriptase|nr:hypothetical protein [Candidatus Marsarchaeota archaeon]
MDNRAIRKNMGKRMDKVMGKKTNRNGADTYKCHICNEEIADPVNLITHMLDHSLSAMESINDLIKDQKLGRVSNSDRTRNDSMRASSERMRKTKGAKKIFGTKKG